MGRINGRKYGFPKNQRPNRMVERAPKRLAGGGRFRQIRTWHCHMGQHLTEVDEERGWSRVRVVSIQDTDERTFVQALQGMEAAAEDPVDGRRQERRREEGRTGSRSGTSSRTILDYFFAHHEGGEQGGPEGGGATGTGLFFVYSLLACDLWRSWRGYVQSVSCPQSAQWRLIASTPFALRPGLSQ